MRQMVRTRYSAQCSMERGLINLVANDNGHHQESKFDNEDKHRHPHTKILQTFLERLHK
jgi:hypothetical protein